jgi:hypothetical protein
MTLSDLFLGLGKETNMNDEIQCDYRRVCELIGAIYYYGNFRAETVNERELEALLRKLGYFFDSEDKLMEKLHPNLIK